MTVAERHIESPRQLRVRRGLSIAEVARRTGLSRWTIWRLEGGCKVSKPARRLYAVALNVPAFTFDPPEEEK